MAKTDAVQIVLLHGVNVAGRKLTMNDFRAACEKAGCAQARTLLASGNAVVRSRDGGVTLETKLERAIAAQTGLKTVVYVRTPKELAAAIKSNPFVQFAQDDPSHMVVLFTKTAPHAGDVSKALAPQAGPEEIAVKGAHAYITYPASIGTSKFKVRLTGTARNWNTVQKLAALAREMDQ